MAHFFETDPTRVPEEVTRLLGYDFKDINLIKEALTHSSYSNEGGSPLSNIASDNERLEFLGDAVIGLVVAQKLMELFPEASEGKLSRWRSTLVSRKTLAEISMELNLGQWMLLGRGEVRTGGAEKRSILAAALEAIVGALYLDGGLPPVERFLGRIYHEWFEDLKGGDETLVRQFDGKTVLQERVQRLYRTTPTYRVVDSWGLEHEKSFKVEIVISGRVVAHGLGKSKKEAEQEAARFALETLGAQ